MRPEKLQPDLVLKKSPFLVVKKLADNEFRVYSKLHGNLTTFDFDINEVLELFASPINLETASKKAFEIREIDSSELIAELYEKRFLVEGHKNDKDIFREYVETVRLKNKIPKISTITFMTSGKCNLACIGCYHHFFDFKSKDMSSDFASQILEGLFPYLEERGIPALQISFLGYEPLLNFETLSNIYDQTCRMGDQHGVTTSFKLYTNAFHLTENTLDWLKANKANLELMVSLDGIKEDNDKRRIDHSGKGTYDKVIENLKTIVQTGIDCRIATVLSKTTFANIEKFIDEIAAIGIKGVTANIFCGNSEEERLMELTEDEKFEAIRRMDLATEKYGIEFDGEWKFAVVQMVTGAHFSCPAGIKQLVFSADGVIYPCQRFAGTALNFGSYEKDFWEKLVDGQCSGYNNWADDLYDGVADRANEEDTDLTGWSCPFVPFIRGECISVNLDRGLNAKLLEYYVTRPLNRIVAKTPINY